MVVQCPNCTSKFRIADEKVTERGVRVRCTACKNVFQVRKGGELKPAAEGVTGTTQEMQALDPALLGGLGAAKPALARPPAAAAPGVAPRKVPPQGASLPPQGRPPGLAPSRPPGTTPRPPGSTSPTLAAPSKPRLQADDLFGMAELTGDAAAMPGSPLSSQNNLQPAEPSARPPPGRPPGARSPSTVARPPPPPPVTAPPPPARPSRPPALSADDFDVDLAAETAGARPLAPPEPGPRAPARPPPPPRTAPPPMRPPQPPQQEARPLPPPPPVADEAPPPPSPFETGRGQGSGNGPVKLGVFKTQLKDPFEGVDLGGQDQREGADELSADKLGGKPKPKKGPVESPSVPPETPAASGRRELVSSALTGLVGAAMALVLVLFAAISEGDSTWNPFVNRSDIVATKVVSGLYDTASGKPIFFVRGRVENRSKKVRGPIRVVAELVTETGIESRSEALAGTEPSAEEVFGLRSSVEVEKLTRLLTRNDAERRVPPGGSLPFFAVIADPPADLQRHKLHVRLESIDAWSAPARPAKTEAEPKPAEKIAPAPPEVTAAVKPAPAMADKPAGKPAAPAEKGKGRKPDQGSAAGPASPAPVAAAAAKPPAPPADPTLDPKPDPAADPTVDPAKSAAPGK